MKMRLWLLFVAAWLAACSAPADDLAPDSPAIGTSEQGVSLLPRLDHEAVPTRLAWRDPAEPRALPANLQRARENLEAAACMEGCGGAPWCAALCELDAFSPVAEAPGADRLEQDCLECGRETGFLPTPPTVEAYREGAGVLVTWTEVEGATQYEVAVLRRKDGRESYTPWADYTVEATELRLSSLPSGYVYVFAVTPEIDGQIEGDLTGISAPLSL